MARSTDSIGAPNVLASSRAPAQAGIETIDVNRTNNVLIGNPFGFPDNYVAIRVPYTGELWRNWFRSSSESVIVRIPGKGRQSERFDRAETGIESIFVV